MDEGMDGGMDEGLGGGMKDRWMGGKKMDGWRNGGLTRDGNISERM